jgi:hypothetical protein
MFYDPDLKLKNNGMLSSVGFENIRQELNEAGV